MEYDIFKPWLTLDQWQKEYLEAEGNTFLLCGRQSGKTTAASIKFGKRAAENPKRIILMIAYTEKQAYNLFFMTLMYLRAVYPKMISKGKDKPTKHIIHLTNGSKIMCYAAGIDGTGIRTFTVTDLVIDEAAPMAREVFTSTTPMLSVTKGTLNLLSTPRGREGYFYECSDDPSLGDKIRKNFTRFYVSAEDCARHSKEHLADEKASMSELSYAQEYLAHFLDDLRRLFTDKIIKERCILEAPLTIPKMGDNYIGCDVARRDKDEFTFEVVNRTGTKNNYRLKHIFHDMTRNIPIPESTRTIITLNEKYNFKKEYIDSGGMGITVCDLLKECPINRKKVVEINNASRNIEETWKKGQLKEKKKKLLKEELYENLVMLMEQGRIDLLKDKDVMRSLASVQFEIVKGKVNIFGNYTHIAEGLIRAAWCTKDKSLKPYIY